MGLAGGNRRQRLGYGLGRIADIAHRAEIELLDGGWHSGDGPIGDIERQARREEILGN